MTGIEMVASGVLAATVIAWGVVAGPIAGRWWRDLAREIDPARTREQVAVFTRTIA